MSIYLYIFTMALTTYLIRMLPLTIFRKPIKSRFLRSFLHYVPYACLTAMTFPAILTSTATIISGAAALVIAVILAYRGKSLLTVSLAASAAVIVTEWLLQTGFPGRNQWWASMPGIRRTKGRRSCWPSGLLSS